MVRTEPAFMRELHAIRFKFAKRMKGKTSEEIVEFIRNQAAKSKYFKRHKTHAKE